MVGLGFLPYGVPGSSSYATGVSSDGAIAVGRSVTPSGQSQAVMWSGTDAPVGLGFLPSTGASDSQAYAVSADGLTIVGSSLRGIGTINGSPYAQTEAFRWTAGTGMVGLGDLPGGTLLSEALAVSGDGSVIVGFGQDDSAPFQHAVIWTDSNGPERLLDVLVARGAAGLEGWQLLTATGVSADGRWVIGAGLKDGKTSAFLADLAVVPLPNGLVLLLGPLALLAGLRRRVD
jgi:uncharacterized membrane protein